MKNKKCLILIVLLLLCITITGCGKKWNKTIQVSEIEYDDGYLVGKIKNLKDEAYSMYIIFQAKSGSLTETVTCSEIIKPYETLNLKCTAYGINDKYQITLDDVELTKYKIPKLETGKIEIETLKYHFKEIYHQHTLNLSSVRTTIEQIKYPCIDNIEYNNDKIKIEYSVSHGEKIFSSTETYDISDNELKEAYIAVNNGDSEFVKDIAFDISLMNSFSKTPREQMAVYKVLLNQDTENGYCTKIGNWCILADYSDILVSFYFLRK